MPNKKSIYIPMLKEVNFFYFNLITFFFLIFN